MIVGQPVLRIVAFQVPEGVFEIVAMHSPVPIEIAQCSEIVPNVLSCQKKRPRFSPKSLVFVVGRAGFEPATNGLKVRCSTS
jgi:hypothetical protein